MNLLIQFIWLKLIHPLRNLLRFIKSIKNGNNKEYYLTEKNENFYLSDDKRIISDKNSKMKNNNSSYFIQ